MLYGAPADDPLAKSWDIVHRNICERGAQVKLREDRTLKRENGCALRKRVAID